ncbi:MAG: TatD family hydrolase [Polyangiales bacterium]
MTERALRELVDTHAHLDVAPLDAAAWQRAHASGVVAALTMGVDPAQWPAAIRLGKSLPGVRHALGIHPQAVPGLDDPALDAALDVLPDLLRGTGAIAIGECGLDGPAGELSRQLRVVRRHLDIARATRLPIVLHVFKLHGPMVELLREVGALPGGGVVHSYSGPAELVKRYLDANLAVSFAGAITRSNAKKPLAAARAVPLDRLLLETDAPYQPAGADARDRTHGDPSDLHAVLAAVAAARGDDRAALAAATTANAARVFPGLLSPAPAPAVRGRTGSGDRS